MPAILTTPSRGTHDLRPFLATALSETDFPFLGSVRRGKVRDIYQPDPVTRVLVATDRQSAFDRLWCTIPLKGQALTRISAWWFERVASVMPHHLRAVPDPNVMVVENLRMFPVEIVVRGYLTGSTATSAWSNYRKGVRNFCGNQLPDGMTKNQPFAVPIITPTTKAEEDELIDPETIVARKYMTRAQWSEVADRALALFALGQEIASRHGLILVDTKYEMGMRADGTIVLGDEVHTPDSSRYWVAATYAERFAAGQEPESLDKEFFRLWLKEHGFRPEDPASAPTVTDDVRLALASRYIDLVERMTGEAFSLSSIPDVPARIAANLHAYFG